MSTHFMNICGFRSPPDYLGGKKGGKETYHYTKWMRIARVLAMIAFWVFILILL